MYKGIEILDIKEFPGEAEPTLFDILAGLPCGRTACLDESVYSLSKLRGSLGQLVRKLGKRFDLIQKDGKIWVKVRGSHANGNGSSEPQPQTESPASETRRMVRDGDMAVVHRRNKYPLVLKMGRAPFSKRLLRMVSRHGGVSIRTNAFRTKSCRHSLVHDLRHKWGCDIVGTGRTSREITITRRRRRTS